MRRMLYLAALCLLCSAVFAPAAVAQDAVCDDFNGNQAAAQAALPTNPQLDRDNDGTACDAFLEGGGSSFPAPAPSPTQPVSCNGFASDFGAQQFFAFNATPEQRAALDPEGDGFACSAGNPAQLAAPAEVKTEVKTETKTEAKAGGTEAKAEAKAPEQKKAEAKKEEKKEMPKTGGVGGASLLALGAGALLVGTGLLIRRVW